MEKFALLNLLKAIDGLKNLSAEQKEPPPPAADAEPSSAPAHQNEDLPNIMYETLVRHETVSNRIRNKK